MLAFNGFQPILKYRHLYYAPKIKPNELTDHDIQILNLPFKEKKRSSQYKVYDVLANTYHYRRFTLYKPFSIS